MTTRIDLIRHGAPEQPGHLLGHTDMGLSPEGWAQFARQVGGRDWARVVTSPLKRARAPAEQLAAERQLPLRVDAGWAEMDFGTWDGCALADLRAHPETSRQLDTFYHREDGPAAPGGESWGQLRTRVERALNTILEPRDGKDVLVATHAGPMRAALSVVCGFPLDQTWTFRLAFGARLSLRVARGSDGRLWGEIIELTQA